MFSSLFTGIFDTTSTVTVDLSGFLICMVVAIIIGVFNAWIYTFQGKYSKSFVTTLAIIPAVVTMIIMMVNGNIGAGVAVAGAFSLVRFRSVPGTAKEIGAIFTAMGSGLTIGMGYIGFAIIFVLFVSVFELVLNQSSLGDYKTNKRILKITIPEDLNYTDVFNDLFKKYTSFYELHYVKTTNMGSLFKLSYEIELKNPKREKAFVDALRCRNGNLEIVITRDMNTSIEL